MFHAHICNLNRTLNVDFIFSKIPSVLQVSLLHKVFAMFSSVLYFAIATIPFLFGFGSSYEILGLFAFPARSHYAVFDPLLVALASRGHNVTVYNTFPKKYSLANYREVDISHCFHLPDILTIPQMQSGATNGFDNLDQVFRFKPSYDEIKNCKQVMELMNTTTKYDLVITESFNHDFFLLFGWLFGIPTIAMHSNSPFTWTADNNGLPYNPSYIPNFIRDFPVRMNFPERVENLMLNLYSLFLYNRHLNVYDEMAKQIFGPEVHPLEDVARNASVLFLYEHFSLSSRRPMVPNVVQIAGLNIKPANSLDKNIEKFINESKHGVVYFCMGSLLRGETFPPEKREAFLYAFSKIPQRVLWKWEGDVLPGKSDNIMISKWMPQRDILAHPNVKLFMFHGGLLRTSEAVNEGVPVLGIPIFGDQRTNIKSLEANGAGAKWKFETHTYWRIVSHLHIYYLGTPTRYFVYMCGTTYPDYHY
ncbi:UDP-glycosyltransferase UGT5-like isoform X50 [Planococcus citri]|uniref:UDP-glycosyltransferase UGT5-like isoform X50 n=1 Tax=Planococcus citri TaxID=170843 RepID=UPI0031F9CC41